MTVTDMEEGDEEFDGGVVVGLKPTVMVPRHINKRSLRNKGLCISFDEKNLRDFVTGFSKRKKKRRKEAKKQLQEKERQIRIDARRKRKEAREAALHGQLKSDLEQDDSTEVEEDEPTQTSATKIYETSNTTITVTTSRLGDDNKEDLEPKHTFPKLSSKLENKHSSLKKRKPIKGPSKPKPWKRNSKPTSRKKDKGNK
ncbi:hypothetical protein HPP92_006711 [Vanilla planifolia]|uniref:Ribosomal RNA-processing protein 17 n=1 Tax=Vanilla planifolia TaxID=51239 RepID=A0A835V8Q3_VANPL|nr:hypothetical protein HPP92_006711 [Vanilla planifolia]